jgi:hypothetical protein
MAVSERSSPQATGATMSHSQFVLAAHLRPAPEAGLRAARRGLERV